MASVIFENIYKKFSQVSVLQGLNLEVRAGEKTLVLGANGAGKSTLLRICSGLLSCEKGKISWQSSPHERSVLPRVGYFSHEVMLYDALTPLENLNLYSELLGLNGNLGSEIDRWGLTAIRDTSIINLSHGSQRKVALARTFLGSPQVMLLDEPTTSLDQAAVELLMKELNSWSTQERNNKVLIVASHDISCFSSWADRILLLENGAISSDSTISDKETVIQQYYSGNR